LPDPLVAETQIHDMKAIPLVDESAFSRISHTEAGLRVLCALWVARWNHEIKDLKFSKLICVKQKLA